MIKVITVAHSSSFPIIQRGGKKIALALSVELAIKPDEIDQLGSSTDVSFGVEEIPLRAAETLQRDHGGSYAVYQGKALPAGETLDALKGHVSRSVGNFQLSDPA